VTLADQDARKRIVEALDETLFVEAGAGSGKTKSLVDRVVALVDEDVEMRSIATITFTEKAAGELRDRIRRAFEERRRAADTPTDADRYTAALEQVDAAAISTLHAFAQRILTEHALEAGLPPNVEVLDEVSSRIEFEDRWTSFREELLDDRALERCLLLAFAFDIGVHDLRNLAVVFQANWDLVAEDDRLPWGGVEPPPVDREGFERRIEALLERRHVCTDAEDKLLRYLEDEVAPFLDRLRQAPDEYEALRLLATDKNPTFRCSNGRAPNWGGAEGKRAVVTELRAIGVDKLEHARQVARAAVRRIAVAVGGFSLAAAQERRESGRLEFHDLLVLARELLRGEHSVEVRRRLHDRYQRLLLDEFQDTDPIQIELAVRIASSDPDAAAKPWEEIPVAAGRLFFVGDPKQSIYRFRRADINLFLRAGGVFGTPPVRLTTNFRTTPPVIDWVNHVFGQLIEHEAGSQPDYEPLTPAPRRTPPPDGLPVVVLGAEAHEDKPNADELREREAADVVDAIEAALGWQVSERSGDAPEQWRPATLADITVLLPARTSLPALERALESRRIPYRAETSSLVYSTREVRDLMVTVRALSDPTDQLALVTALRSPVFGCGDDDLFTFRVEHGGRWSLDTPLPETLPADHPVGAALTYLAQLRTEVPWLAPAELLQRIAADRRLFELGYAMGRPRDLWRRLRFVIDQARAWSEAEGGTLREYVTWSRLQASDNARVAETVLPETDDESVRILTIHGAKGLEFPITIVSGMTSRPGGQNQRVDVAFPDRGPAAIKVGSAVVTPEYEAYKPVDEQMDFHERLRLLYVACTRAQDHLVVSLHRPLRNQPEDSQKLTSAELLAGVAGDAPHQAGLPEPAGAPAPGRDVRGEPPALPDLAAWEAERAAALVASSRRRTVGASDVELAVAPEDAESAEGIDKAPRDLELPPWQKGRYGSAIGRAVHAVLQTVDLATGDGLEEAARAQAAAEGVLGREGDIARLARAALSAPCVREAAASERWRETYVATPLDGHPDGAEVPPMLEGYIDLLYRSAEGLVIVDYKTASAGADLDQRMRDYRAQGGAYALAVEQATGEPVARVVFLFLTADGPVERDLADLAGAKQDVRHAVARMHPAV
jgi:ATP-dependent helicase/nuclease subunit A